ncbi:Uncharacterised protein [Serratia quinivorans]|nr:Uncharacterised protein [Serratia quinivorans]
MPINFAPKVGEILECNYGNYPAPIPTLTRPIFIMATFHQKW